MGCPKEAPPIFDLYVIVAKMHIYSCKFDGCVPTVQGFTRKMNNIKSIEKYIATTNDNMDKYNKKWLITNEDWTFYCYDNNCYDNCYVNTLQHTIMLFLYGSNKI